MRKEGINPLTNDGQYADTTYKRAVEKRSRENFFYAFCRRAFRRANAELMKRLHIKKYSYNQNCKYYIVLNSNYNIFNRINPLIRIAKIKLSF